MCVCFEALAYNRDAYNIMFPIMLVIRIWKSQVKLSINKLWLSGSTIFNCTVDFPSRFFSFRWLVYNYSLISWCNFFFYEIIVHIYSILLLFLWYFLSYALIYALENNLLQKVYLNIFFRLKINFFPELIQPSTI